MMKTIIPDYIQDKLDKGIAPTPDEIALIVEANKPQRKQRTKTGRPKRPSSITVKTTFLEYDETSPEKSALAAAIGLYYLTSNRSVQALQDVFAEVLELVTSDFYTAVTEKQGVDGTKGALKKIVGDMKMRSNTPVGSTRRSKIKEVEEVDEEDLFDDTFKAINFTDMSKEEEE